MSNFIPAVTPNAITVKAAKVENGVVINVIEVDPNNTEFLKDYGAVLIPSNLSVDHGWKYDGTTFIPKVITIDIRDQARLALDASDSVIVRCYSASVPVPIEWNTYRSALRAIVSGTDTTSTTLSTKPAYPAGT